MRFSQALGFEGFPELQEAAREEYRHHHRSAITPEPATPLFSLDQSPFEQAVAADHVNVEDTARHVSRSEVDGAIEAIAAAERILIAGTDQMAFFASYLRHLLMLLDVRAEIAASARPRRRCPARPDRRAHAGDRASAPAARTRWSCAAMKIARHRRAARWRSSDATLSDVSKLVRAHALLLVELAGLRALAHGLLSILQALAYGVYARDTASYDDRIRAFPAQVSVPARAGPTRRHHRLPL